MDGKLNTAFWLGLFGDSSSITNIPESAILHSRSPIWDSALMIGEDGSSMIWKSVVWLNRARGFWHLWKIPISARCGESYRCSWMEMLIHDKRRRAFCLRLPALYHLLSMRRQGSQNLLVLMINQFLNQASVRWKGSHLSSDVAGKTVQWFDLERTSFREVRNISLKYCFKNGNALDQIQIIQDRKLNNRWRGISDAV